MLASLRFRLWLTYLLVVSVVVTITGLALIVYLLRNPAIERRELQRLRLVAQVALQRRRFFDERDQSLAPLDRLDQVAVRLDGVLNARLIVFDTDGSLLVDSRAYSAARAAPTPPLAELQRPRLQRAGIFRDEFGQQWLYALTPFNSGQTLITAAPRPNIQLLTVLRDEFVQPFVRALIIALALSFLMTILIAGWITAPLQRLTDAVRSVAQGEFRRIPPAGPREIQTLARSFNEMTERVETSQRAQRDLVANISHDLKTPLTSIQGFAQALLDGAAAEPADAQRAAQVIYDEAARMNRMLLGLLDLARFEAGQPEMARSPFDLAALLRSMAQKFAAQARQAGVALQLDLPGDAPLLQAPLDGTLMMIGDPDRLGQVFANLLDNALKYSQAGGQVRLAVQSRDGWVEVRVEDDGPGIPPAELERIFERFYQTDKSRRSGRAGAGLGLAIAREIIRAHGGAIHAENRSAPAGAAFIVRLPLAQPDDETFARRRSQPPGALTKPS
jgi:signal transduction histidine kinase